MTRSADAESPAAIEAGFHLKHKAGLVDFIDRHFKWFTLGPAALLLLFLTAYPLIDLFAMSVHTISFSQAKEIWTFTPLANLRDLFSDDIFAIALWNTLVFAVISVSVEMVLGLALAILVASVTAGKGLIRTILIVPILMPPVAIGSMWKLMFNLDFGVINQALMVVGLQPVDWLGSLSVALFSIIIVDIWHWTPFVFLILFAAAEGLPKEVIEAARIDGARNRDLVFKIIVPLMKPAIAVALLFRVILAFKVFDEVFLLTSGGPGTSTEVVSLHLYKVFFEENQIGYGALLSLAIIAATIAFLWVGQRAATAVGRR